MSNPPPSSNSSVRDIIASAQQYLPGMAEAIRGQILPFEQTQLEAAQAVSPGYAELMNQLYSQYAPGLAETGARVDDISRRGAAGTDLSLLTDYAPALRRAYEAANPEESSVKSAAAAKLGELLGSINLGDPSPEAERLIGRESARTGNMATPSATSTVGNALSFGREMENRRNQLGQAITVASQFLPASQAGFNPVTNILNRGASNTGVEQFAGVKSAGSDAQELGANLLGTSKEMKGQQNELKYRNKDSISQYVPNISI